MEKETKVISDEQIENLQEIQTNKFISQLVEENKNLKDQLKVTEEDRDNAKQMNIPLLALCIEILEENDIEIIKEKVKQAVHKCKEEANKNL